MSIFYLLSEQSSYFSYKFHAVYGDFKTSLEDSKQVKIKADKIIEKSGRLARAEQNEMAGF